MRRAAVGAIAALAGAACIPDPGPTMSPGQDCLECHDGGDAKRWTVAGTVYRTYFAELDQGISGVRVHLTDATGRHVAIESNEAGNFYTRERLTFPVTVAVEKDGDRREMPHPAPYGGCNRCHTQPPLEGAPGRVYVGLP